MDEYIDRSLCEIVAEFDQHYRLIVPLSKIRKLPAADVAPVVHGKRKNKKGSPVSCYWTKDMKYLMVQEEAYCSVCGEYLNASAEYTVEGTFCPHCSAKMDGGQHETD